MSEQETIPESGVVESSKLYIAEKKVKRYEVAVGETPSGGRLIFVEYSDNTNETFTEANFDAVKTYAKGDATKRRDKLVRASGMKIYALIMEYGPTLPEVDHILNEAVRLVNDASEEAVNTLWGVEHTHLRSILDVNRILSEKHARKDSEKTEAGDGPAS